MKNTDKRLVRVTECILNDYDGSFTRDQLVKLMDDEIARVTDAVGDIKFEMELEEKWYQYQERPSCKAAFQMKYNRYETDAELSARNAVEEKAKADQKARNQAEFDRLKKLLNA